MREPLGQAASRTSGGAGVRAGGVAADAMDRPCPAGPDRLGARPPAAPGRARQLASLGPSGPPAHPALAHVPDRATRPAARTGRAGARHPVRPAAGAPARRPSDALVPVDTGRRLARALPDARLQLVPGAGHHLPRRAPDAVADAVAAFLAAVEDPASPG